MLLQTIASAQNVDVLHYRFFITLNDKNDTVFGKTEIRAVIRTTGALELDLIQKGSNGKGMEVTSVEKDEHMKPYPFSQEKNKLIIPILKGVPGDTLVLRVYYKGVPADGLIISKNKFGQRTFFADNWPNRAHHWIPCVDRPDDKASFEFLVNAPKQYKVVSNGIKVAETNPNDATTLTHWKEVIPQATKVMVIGVAKFAVKEYAQKPGGVAVSAWVYPKDSTKGFYDYGLTPEILAFFANYIGPFPYQKLANVQSTTTFGGMENASAIFYAESSVTGNRSEEDLLAHEIAHQWFGDAVSEKSFAHLWLSEGFASFFTHFYFEKKYGKETAAKRWQEAREEVIAFARQSAQPVVDSTKNLMSLLNPNSYNKGAWVLHMLRNDVGDENFQTIVQTYYRQFRGSNAETSDLKSIAEKVSGKDLSLFFEQWLYRPGIPVLQISTKVQEDTLYLYIEQKGKPFQVTLEADFVLHDGELVRKQFAVNEASHVFKLPIKGSAVKFSLDPDTKLLYKAY